MICFEPPNIYKMKAKKNVRGLIKALGYQTNQKTKNRKQAVINILLKLKVVAPRIIKPHIANLLSKVNRGGDGSRYRRVAADALGRIGDPRAVEPLIFALQDEQWDVRREVASALGIIGDPRAVEPLIPALKVVDSEMRQAAADALGRIGDPRAVEPLIFALQDVKWDVRYNAADALGRIGDLSAVGPLIFALKDNEYQVRKAAAVALDKIGWLPDQSADGAFYWIAKQEWFPCIMIGSSAVDPLIAALKDNSGYVRKEVARALGIIGDPRAVEPLIAALVDELKVVRPIAAEALDKIGWLPDEGTDGATYWVTKNEWDRCVKIGAPAVDPLIAALTDNDSKMRQAAARSLGRIGDPRAVEPLIFALKDNEWQVRRVAAEALGEITDPRALLPLITLLRESNWHIRRNAANALVQLYKSDLLNKVQQNKLLRERTAIIEKHVDKNDWGPHDCAGHTDTGIGVSFPV